MRREWEAYIHMNRVAYLKDRIPRFLFWHGCCLYLQYIEGEKILVPLQSLRMSFEQLREAEEILRRSLELLHESGISHGDVNAGNVIVRPDFWKTGIPHDRDLVLIDFTRATFQVDDPDWEQKKKYDFDGLDEVFFVAHSKLVSRTTSMRSIL